MADAITPFTVVRMPWSAWLWAFVVFFYPAIFKVVTNVGTKYVESFSWADISGFWVNATVCPTLPA